MYIPKKVSSVPKNKSTDTNRNHSCFLYPLNILNVKSIVPTRPQRKHIKVNALARWLSITWGLRVLLNLKTIIIQHRDTIPNQI